MSQWDSESWELSVVYRIANKRTKEFLYFVDKYPSPMEKMDDHHLLDAVENARKYYETQPDSRIRRALSNPLSCFEAVEINSGLKNAMSKFVNTALYSSSGWCGRNIQCLHCDGKDYEVLAAKHMNADLEYLKTLAKTITPNNIPQLIDEIQTILQPVLSLENTKYETLDYWKQYAPGGRPKSLF